MSLLDDAASRVASFADDVEKANLQAAELKAGTPTQIAGHGGGRCAVQAPGWVLKARAGGVVHAKLNATPA